jgi:hypothetical protein
MPQFTALNGQEYKKVILDKVSEELENSGLCATNLTYPWIKFSFVFKHTSYPQAPMEQEPQPVVSVEVTQGEAGLEPPPPENRTVAVVDPMAVVIDTPDQARVDADLPIPTPTPLVNIGIVDKMVKQAPKGKGK